MGKKSNIYYEEYFINDTYLKKLYNMYVHKHFLDKVLDIFVFVAIVMTVMGVVMEIFGDLDTNILIIIHSFSTLILMVFGLELLRNYARSKSKRHFFKKHWVDFILIVFLSFYFIFVSFSGFVRFVFLDMLKPLFQDAKHFRIFYKIFRR